MPARGASTTRLGTRRLPSIQGSPRLGRAATRPLWRASAVALEQQAQPGQREQVVDLLDLLRVGHDESGQATRRDHGRALVELHVQAPQDRVYRAGVAEHDARADGI